jgi:broad specificity phosphatase PhoE
VILRRPRLAPALVLLALSLFPVPLLLPQAAAAQEGTVLFLVRHAERAEDGGDDPHLSPAGRERAALLGRMLANARVTHIHSTDLHRTRETAAPLQAIGGLEVETYFTMDVAGFAARLREMPGRHLVVGHSNTLPPLVRALGGEPGPDIETMEYDRLYVVTLGRQGVTTILLRFGAPFGG